MFISRPQIQEYTMFDAWSWWCALTREWDVGIKSTRIFKWRWCFHLSTDDPMALGFIISPWSLLLLPSGKISYTDETLTNQDLRVFTAPEVLQNQALSSLSDVEKVWEWITSCVGSYICWKSTWVSLKAMSESQNLIAEKASHLSILYLWHR